VNETQVEVDGKAGHRSGKDNRDTSPRRGKRMRLPPLVAVERGAPLPLSFAQERLWFLEQLGLVGTAYNIPFGLKLEGELNTLALERSFQELLRRHESLRTHFVNVDGIPAQVIDAPTLFSLPVEDLSSLSAEEKGREWKRLSGEEARRSFDLRKGPLLRAVLLKLEALEHILLVTIHHIAADGWSLGIL